MKKTILVTGSAGFIGFSLCKSLLADANNIIVGVDNFNDYYDVELKNYRVSILKKHFNFKQFEIDISHKEKIKELFSSYKFDIVINLAAQAGVRYSITNPDAYIQSNIVGFENILENCRHHNIKRLIYASSSSVYGGIKEFPYSEKMNVDKPISLYAATKKSNELMAHTYSHLYNLETIGLRFFTVYGPFGRPDMAIWLFPEAIIKNEEIQIFNNGNMKRDFTYIDDIVSGIEKCMELDMKERNYEIYNLGNNKPENLMDVVEIIEDKLKIKARKKFMPLQDGDVVETYADIEKAKKDFDFNPKTSIKEGVDSFVDWYINEWLPYIKKNENN
jgi:UDP-glucuronate 4-epimerase